MPNHVCTILTAVTILCLSKKTYKVAFHFVRNLLRKWFASKMTNFVGV